MNKEFEALSSNHTWGLVALPKGKKVICCKWVYKIKLKADGTIERYKARLVTRVIPKSMEWIMKKIFL